MLLFLNCGCKGNTFFVSVQIKNDVFKLLLKNYALAELVDK